VFSSLFSQPSLAFDILLESQENSSNGKRIFGRTVASKCMSLSIQSFKSHVASPASALAFLVHQVNERNAFIATLTLVVRDAGGAPTVLRTSCSNNMNPDLSGGRACY
jgi:hypothetical protein